MQSMTKNRVLVSAACLVFATAALAARPQAVPDLSGTWKVALDRASSVGGGGGAAGGPGGGRGGGLGLGPLADELTVRQTAATMTVVERRGTAKAEMSYALDGRTVKNVLPAGRSSGAPATYTSRWADGRLVTTIIGPPAPGSVTPTHYEETRYLDTDGSLVVETKWVGQPHSRRVVYTKGK